MCILEGGFEESGCCDHFMGTLEVISEFVPFLKTLIEKYGNVGKGTRSYLSSTMCLEFIEVMGERVLAEIISQIKGAKYFSISVNSTPDVAHTDQIIHNTLCVNNWACYRAFCEISANRVSFGRITFPGCSWYVE